MNWLLNTYIIVIVADLVDESFVSAQPPGTQVMHWSVRPLIGFDEKVVPCGGFKKLSTLRMTVGEKDIIESQFGEHVARNPESEQKTIRTHTMESDISEM